MSISNPYKETLKSFKKEITNLENEISSPRKKAEKGIVISKNYLRNIKNIMLKNEFKNETEEIYFFKQIKPEVYSYLVYYINLYNIENNKPSGKKELYEYLKEKVLCLKSTLYDNIDFYNYYKKKDNAFDQFYFLRKNAHIKVASESYHYALDKVFSTSHDIDLAKFIAYEKLILMMENELLSSNQKIMPALAMDKKLRWTTKKVYLVELIYALHANASINWGEISLKELADGVGEIFEIDIPDFYRVFLEIKSRKSSQTLFLDKLKNSLQKKIDDSDGL